MIYNADAPQLGINKDSFLSSAWQALLPTLWDQGKGLTDANRTAFTSQIGALHDSFANQFTSLVGRAPTQDELNTFSNNFVKPHIANLTNPQDPYSQNTDTYLQSFIGNNYQQQAKDYATGQLQGQVGQAQQLSDLFRKQGNDAINSTEQGLLDYQSRLFEKLRPNLITSLQSQGLLNTGGLNDAMAGAQGDLANSVQPFLAQARLSNDQQANQIAFAGASAPYQYQQSNALNQVPYLQSMGQQAAGQGYNTFLTNLNYQNQMSLMNQQANIAAANKPGFGSTFGNSFANSLGNNLGADFNAPNWLASARGGGQSSGGRTA